MKTSFLAKTGLAKTGLAKAATAAVSVAFAVTLATGLSGCVSLFPKAEPAQLYRFQGDFAEPAQATNSNRTPVAMSPLAFTEAASGDRLLTMTGNEAAYIGGARWVASAQELFQEALGRAFARNSTAVRMVDRRQSASANMVLNVDVETFETRYVAGPNAAPTVVVSLRAQVIRYPERTVIAEKTFHAEQPASDNRVSAIVPAYGAAVTSVLKDLTAWTDGAAQNGG